MMEHISTKLQDKIPNLNER